MMSRLLDRAIAELLGHKLVKPGTEVFGILLPENDFFKQESETAYRRVPNYCEDGNAMLELDREMSWRGWFIRSMMVFIGDIFIGYSLIEDDEIVRTVVGQAETEPLARALAVYKALTGKEWSE